MPAFKEQWNSTTTYLLEQRVTDLGVEYFLKVPNSLNQVPAATPTSWVKVFTPAEILSIAAQSPLAITGTFTPGVLAAASVTDTVVAVGTTSTTLVTITALTIGVQVFNAGGGDVFIRYDGAPATVNDTALFSNQSRDLSFTLSSIGAITAISSAGSNNVKVIHYQK